MQLPMYLEKLMKSTGVHFVGVILLTGCGQSANGPTLSSNSSGATAAPKIQSAGVAPKIQSAVTAVSETGASPILAAASGSYEVDPVHSSLVFRVKHFGVANFYGRFNNVTGSFTLDAADVAKNVFEIQIQADSVDTAIAKRDQHLKSPDFLNAKQFPTITFKSTSVKSKDGESFEVTGDLTLHGVTKPVTGTVTVTGAGKGFGGRALAGVDANFTIKRSDFDMKFMLEGLSDEIQIIAGLEGGRK
jgi:polyisoprenoid-binding protein YceI